MQDTIMMQASAIIMQVHSGEGIPWYPGTDEKRRIRAKGRSHRTKARHQPTALLSAGRLTVATLRGPHAKPSRVIRNILTTGREARSAIEQSGVRGYGTNAVPIRLSAPEPMGLALVESQGNPRIAVALASRMLLWVRCGSGL